MPRRLIVYPEHHHRPRLAEAVRKAKELQGQDGASGITARVKLFSEGVSPVNVARRSKEAGFPLTPIEHEGLNALALRLASMGSITEMNAIQWALANPENAGSRRILERLGERTAGGIVITPERLEAVRDAIGANINHMRRQLAGAGLDIELMDGLLREVEDNSRWGLSSALPELMELLVGHPLEQRLDAINSKIYGKRALLMAAGTGLAIPCVVFDTRMFEALYKGLNRSVAAFQNRLEAIYERVQHGREQYIGGSVAGEEFDTGVLRIGAGHMERGRLEGWFRTCGIGVEIVPIESV